MEALRSKARELLEPATVKVVIGYGRGTRRRGAAGLRPRRGRGRARWSSTTRCRQNLAVYLLKPEVQAAGQARPSSPRRPRCAPSCSSRPRTRSTDGERARPGRRPTDGTVAELADLAAIEAHVAHGSPRWRSPPSRRSCERIDGACRSSERWQFWAGASSPAASSATPAAPACPMCYCTRCTVGRATSRSGSRWRPTTSATWSGTSCGPCTWPAAASTAATAPGLPGGHPAEPADRKLIGSRRSPTSDCRSGMAAKGDYALSTFKPDDKEDFIR